MYAGTHYTSPRTRRLLNVFGLHGYQLAKVLNFFTLPNFLNALNEVNFSFLEHWHDLVIRRV